MTVDADALEAAVRKFLEICDDLAAFDGDRRGIACAKTDAENEMRKLLGFKELENDY